MTSSAQAAGRFFHQFGTQVATSIAVTLSVAALSAAPGMIWRRDAAPASQPVHVELNPAATAKPALAAPGAKFSERGPAFAEEEAEPVQRGLLLPAAALMPMSVAWAASEEAGAALTRPAASERKLPSPQAVHLVQVQRPPARPTAIGHSAIRPIEVAVAETPTASGPVHQDEATVLGVPLPNSIVRAGRTIGGAASAVGSAGAWTVSAAASLLPSF